MIDPATQPSDRLNEIRLDFNEIEHILKAIDMLKKGASE